MDWAPEALHAFLEDDPESGLLRQEASTRMRVLVDALDRQSRDLILLRFAAGLRVPEIAVVLGTSEAATYKRLTRTLQKLKERYCAATP